MKQQILLLFTFCFMGCTQQNKIYFDVNWEETTPENAAYYRLIPTKENNLWQINDFYSSGEKQFVGQAKDSMATQLEGDVTWYFKTGKVQSKVRYVNGTIVGGFTSFEGAKGSVNEGWDEKDLYFYENKNVANAQSVSNDVYEYYYTNTSIVASQHIHHVGDDDKVSFSLYFNKNGDTIGRLDKNKASEKWNGIEVLFYETEQRGKNGMNSVKEMKTYVNGAHTESTYYDTNEKQIAKGSFKEEAPFTGTFFNEFCSYKKIRHYENGFLLKEVTFNSNDENIGEISFKNEVPDTGIYYNCTSLKTYKNGKLNGDYIQYFDDAAIDVELRYTYKNGQKHGDYFINQGVGELLEKGSYNNGEQTGDVWYYQNGAYIEEGDMEAYYYLKANVRSKADKLFITELSQYNLENHKLLQTFHFEKNNTDDFTYIDNGYHTVYSKDFNNDGFNDLQITFIHHIHDSTKKTYYLFNPETNKYQHIAVLDEAETVVFNPSEKSVEVTYDSRFSDQFTLVTYHFQKNKLIKRKEIEKVYHREKDTTIITQLFPVPVHKYPLLDPTLPPISIVQHGKEQAVTNINQTIKLKKDSFSITFPGMLYKEGSHVFVAKVMASYDMTIFNVAEVDQKEEDTPFHGEYASIAYDPNDPELYVSDDSYNLLYYDDSNDDNLSYIKNLNQSVFLVQLTIDKIFDDGKSVPISEINKPTYLVIFIDKNENKKIEQNEINYITFN